MRVRTIGALLALALLAGACGVEADDSLAATIEAGGLRAVPSSIEFLGDLPVPLGAAKQSTIDPSGATVELDGAQIVAAQGAFSSATAVTAQSFALDVAPSENAWARAYIVSTVDDVALGAPVVIEIPRPAASLRAIQIIDGQASVAAVGGTDMARIEIPHFSEVTTLVVESFNQQRAAERARAAQGAADAAFLETCLLTLQRGFGGDALGQDRDRFDPMQTEFALDLAFSLCTTALVRRASPSGVYVSTACVGERIGGIVDLRAAIAECVADQAEDDSAADSDTQDATAIEADPGEAAESTADLFGTYNGYVRFASHFDHADGGVTCTATLELSIVLGTDGVVRGGPRDQHTFFGKTFLEPGECGLLGRSKPIDGTWTPDGAIEFTMDGATMVGSTDGVRLTFELNVPGGYVRTTTFRGCATKLDIDPGAQCPQLAAEFAVGESILVPDDGG